MNSFTKLDSRIVDSTVWMQPHDALRVWIAMLAKTDATGYVRASVPAMAHLCLVPIERLEEILSAFTSPDPYSRTPADEGRRLRAVEGGWVIVNYPAYRNSRDTENDKATKREWDRQHRPSGHARSRCAGGAGSPKRSVANPKQSAVSPKQSVVSPKRSKQSVAVRSSPPQAEAEADTEKTTTTVSDDLVWPFRVKELYEESIEKVLDALDPAVQQQILDELAGALLRPAPPSDLVGWVRGTVENAGRRAFVPSLGIPIAAARARRVQQDAETQAQLRMATDRVTRIKDPMERKRRKALVAEAAAELGLDLAAHGTSVEPQRDTQYGELAAPTARGDLL
jgi:hypothetical protein